MISIETTNGDLIMFNLKDYESELSFLALLERACKDKQKKTFKVREEKREFEIRVETVNAFYFEKRRYVHLVGELIEKFISAL